MTLFFLLLLRDLNGKKRLKKTLSFFFLFTKKHRHSLPRARLVLNRMSRGRGRRGGGVAPRGIRVLGVSSMLLLLLSLSLLLLLPSALCEGATETTTPTMTMAATAAASTGEEELPAGEEEEETTPEATAPPPPLAASTGTASAAAAGATAATTGSATASSSAATATAATAASAASPSAPGLYYSDAPPPLPFNPWQALTIQEHEALTRVVDGFLRLTGEAGAQPTRVPPGVRRMKRERDFHFLNSLFPSCRSQPAPQEKSSSI